MPKKPDIITPTAEEDAAINAGIAADPDNPELSPEMFAKATTIEASTLPESFKAQVRRGRPKASVTKQHINIRLSPEVLRYFRAQGKGWQTRIDAALQEYVASHRGHT